MQGNGDGRAGIVRDSSFPSSSSDDKFFMRAGPLRTVDALLDGAATETAEATVSSSMGIKSQAGVTKRLNDCVSRLTTSHSLRDLGGGSQRWCF